VGNLKAKVERQLRVSGGWGKLFPQQTWLDIAVVLVFARVFHDIASHLMIEDLANGHASVNPDRLDGVHFKRPKTRKANVSETRCHMNEQP
jgi:hypothetical protein